MPFSDSVPGFFQYLRDERGLRDSTIEQYRYKLQHFASYLKKLRVGSLSDLSPVILSGFIANRSQLVGKRTLGILCAVLRTFLLYLHCHRLTVTDLSRTIEYSQTYRFSEIPRSITWDEVRRMLEIIDRHIFFRVPAPHTPMSWASVSMRAGKYLRKAGIQISRPGSHTLRHTCVQRLVDVGFDLKTIGDYVGHRSPSARII